MLGDGFGFHQLGYLLLVGLADDLSVLATPFALSSIKNIMPRAAYPIRAIHAKALSFRRSCGFGDFFARLGERDMPP